MNEYTVIWRIEVEASSPEVAALIAREIQQDPENIATVYEVVLDFDGSPVVVDTEGLQ